MKNKDTFIYVMGVIDGMHERNKFKEEPMACFEQNS